MHLFLMSILSIQKDEKYIKERIYFSKYVDTVDTKENHIEYMKDTNSGFIP